jgi:hypothetical protein
LTHDVLGTSHVFPQLVTGPRLRRRSAEMVPGKCAKMCTRK